MADLWVAHLTVGPVLGTARRRSRRRGAEGTPIRAADSGRVALAAWTGGCGNYTCIQHTASMAASYAHKSRNTGNSFGAHLHSRCGSAARP
ncbi:MAG: M23 family metallopeptidase [Thermoleophilaceae bacterium]